MPRFGLERLFRRLLTGFVLTCLSGLAKAEDLPEGFVHLSTVAPQIAQDIRYARSFNFTGAPVPGYEAAECILRLEVAQALILVEARLNAEGYALILWDCYRPIRAVRHFADWAETGDGPDMGGFFFPDLDRTDLSPQGYVARKSLHATGTAVDIGLIRLDDTAMQPTGADGSRCDAPFNARPPESAVDMGTAFDCFSPRSGDRAELSPEARANRLRLDTAMRAEGFEGYSAEWWHYRLPVKSATAADFPVTAAP